MSTSLTFMGILFCVLLSVGFVIYVVANLMEWWDTIHTWKKVQGENVILTDRLAKVEAELEASKNGPYRVAAAPDIGDLIDPPRSVDCDVPPRLMQRQ